MPCPEQKPGQSKQDYATPVCFIEPVKTLLGIKKFKFDFAADSQNRKANAWFSVGDNALSTHWNWADELNGCWGWLNPPYSNIGDWAERCLKESQEGARIAFLVPASVGSNWYRDYIHRKALVLALNGRIPFMPDKPTWLYPKDCMLVLFGPDVDPDFDVWNWRTS